MDRDQAMTHLGEVLKSCFNPDFHGVPRITVRYENVIASWWWDRHDYISRRWELSVRMNNGIVTNYMTLNDADRATADERTKDQIISRLGQIESLENSEVPDHPNFICDLDNRTFDK